MTDKNRRKGLKALAVTAPAVWAKPVVDSVLLPAHASTSGAGCVEFEPGNFADFQGGNALPIFSPNYINSECSQTNGVIGNALVYAPQGDSQALSLCQSNFGITEISEEDNDVWNCINP